MSKINVLHIVASNKFSGAEKVAWQICQNVDKNKFNTYIICNGGNLFKKYKNDGLNVFDLNVSSLRFSNFKRFCGIVQRHKIDIVHAHDNRASLFSLICRVLFFRNYRIISHVHTCYDWLKGAGVLKFVDRLSRNCYDVNMLCGKRVYDFYVSHGKYIDVSKVKTLSNAIEIQKVNSTNSASIRDKYNIKADEFVLGFVGRFVKEKGLKPFILNFSENKSLLDKVKVMLVGSGQEENGIRDLIEELALWDKFILTGYQENSIDFINSFDLFILPSLMEGLPMVLLEAMSIGKPTLSFDVGSISEIIENGVNGYVITAGDYEEFFRCISELVGDGDKRFSMGDRAKAKVLREYGLDDYICGIEGIYSRVLA